MPWLTEHLGTILIVAVLLLVIAGAVFVLVRDKRRGKSACGCNCAGCALKGSCHQSKKK